MFPFRRSALIELHTRVGGSDRVGGNKAQFDGVRHQASARLVPLQTAGAAAQVSEEADTFFALNSVSSDPAPDLSPVLGETEGAGSNGWVAAGSMTGSGKAMLANDPHLQTPNDKWWDDPATSSKVETRDDVLARLFSEGYADAVAALGKDRPMLWTRQQVDAAAAYKLVLMP